MTRFLKLPAVLLGLSFALPALAQPAAPTEQVTVTGTRLQDQIQSFVQSFAAPSPALGKLARWHDGICPTVAGVPPVLAAEIVQRVKEVAVLAGAPLAAAGCHANIDIVFSNQPQRLLDDVRIRHPAMLGYHDMAQEEALSKVIHPVQAWYATQTADWNGMRDVDNKESMDQVNIPGGRGSLNLLGVRAEKVSGYRMNDGLSSELFHVIVVVDAHSVGGDTIGPISDYAAMLALAQTAAFQTCPAAPSVTSVVTADCASRARNLTWTDLAYLQALYKADPTGNLAQQRHDIAEAMSQTLGAVCAGKGKPRR